MRGVHAAGGPVRTVRQVPAPVAGLHGVPVDGGRVHRGVPGVRTQNGLPYSYICFSRIFS